MKRSHIFLMGLLMSWAIHSGVLAQELTFSTTTSGGVAFPILDNGLGFFMGINPAYHVRSRLSIESQLSFSYLDISSAFLSGAKGNDRSINFLAGGRLYWSKPDKENRIYSNLLLGYNHFSRHRLGDTTFRETNLGYSLGVYLERKQWSAGLAIESYTYAVVKVGRIF